MKIKSKSFKNRTNEEYKIILNSKLLHKNTLSSVKSSDNIENPHKIRLVQKTLKNKYFMSEKTNKKTKDNSTNIDTFDDLQNKMNKNIKNGQNIFLHNIYLANVLKMKSATNHHHIKTINLNINNLQFENSGGTENETRNYKKNYLFNSNSTDNIKKNKIDFVRKRINYNIKRLKNIMKYQNIKDINIRPSSGKSWLFDYEAKKPKINRYNIQFPYNYKKIIPKINLMKRINNSILINKERPHIIENDKIKKKSKMNFINYNNNYNKFNSYNSSINNNSYKKKNNKSIFNKSFTKIINKKGMGKHNDKQKKVQLNNQKANSIISNYINESKKNKVKRSKIKNDSLFRLKKLFNNYSSNINDMFHNNDKKYMNYDRNSKDNDKDNSLSISNNNIILNNLSPIGNSMNEEHTNATINKIFL